MLNMIKHAHSGLRWVVLALLVYATINAFLKWRKGATFTEGDRKLNLFTLIFTHIQLLTGVALYFMSNKVVMDGASMKDSVLRFFLLEHPFMMVLAVILITVGYSKSKKLKESVAKFKTSFILFALALLALLAGIPWPFRELGAGWY